MIRNNRLLKYTVIYNSEPEGGFIFIGKQIYIAVLDSEQYRGDCSVV